MAARFTSHLSGSLALALVLLSFLQMCRPHDSGDSKLTIQLQTGVIVGKEEAVSYGRNVDIFLGIPYAQPPIGKLRFKAPQPVKPWKEVRNATDFTPQCLRGPVKGHNGPLGIRSEDCLYLNVYRPGNRAKDQQYPVMVWIHGGGFYHGSGNKYIGSVLASHHDVIVVTINYRLGLLGFLHAPDTELKGNYGMLDQVMALKWIQENIHSFGGNPKRVTIFGESAGGASVDLLILSPLAKGLFNYAILQSGSSTCPWSWTKSKDPFQYGHFLEKVGCDYNKDLLPCLQQKSSEEIIESQGFYDYLLLGSYYPVPVVDGEFLPDEPRVLLSPGKFNHLDAVMLGCTKDEGTTFMYGIEPDINTPPSKELFHKMIDKTWFVANGGNELTKQAILYEYTNHTDPYSPESLRRNWADLMSDSFFVASSIYSALTYATAGINAYFYQFSHRSAFSTRPKNTGVPHFDELQYVFGSPWKPNAYTDRAKHYTDVEKGLSTMIMRMWTDFSKYGNPGNNEMVNWPKYTAHDQQYLDISLTPGVKSHLHADRAAFWNKLLPILNKVGHLGTSNHKNLKEEL